MSIHSCIQKLCSKTVGKHVYIDRNATIEWLLVTACFEFIDLYDQQICLSSVHGLSWCSGVLWYASACLHPSDNLRVWFLIVQILTMNSECLLEWYSFFFCNKRKNEGLLVTNQCFVSFYVFFDGNFLLFLRWKRVVIFRLCLFYRRITVEVWGLFDRATSSWNNLKCQLDATRYYPHRTHDPRSGCQDHHPSKNSVQKTICCNLTSNTPDDGRMYPKHVELRIHQ